MGEMADYDAGDGLDYVGFERDWLFDDEVKEGGVNREIEAEVARTLRQKQIDAEVAKRLKLIEAYGKDTYPVGAVLRFNKQFTNGGTAYMYAAIKCENGRWYTSGPKSREGYYWNEFVGWLVGGVPVDQIEAMVPAQETPEWRPVPRDEPSEVLPRLQDK